MKRISNWWNNWKKNREFEHKASTRGLVRAQLNCAMAQLILFAVQDGNMDKVQKLLEVRDKFHKI